MTVVRKKTKLRQIIKDVKGKKVIGFVPTMGYLHEGHLSLIRIAKKKSDFLVVSIFVNPTQFGPDEDYKDYPRDLDRDLKLLKKEGVDLVFAPDEDIYKPNHSTYVIEQDLSRNLCGRSRPSHFQGVTTVVAKLFDLVNPDLSVFGAKDYQQAQIVKRMIRDLDFDIEVVIGPTIREDDGLAMSSRNEYLSPEEREKATVLYKSLKVAKRMVDRGVNDSEQIRHTIASMIDEVGGEINYIEIVDPDFLVPLARIKGEAIIALAVKFGNTRLIDNIKVRFQGDN